MSYDDERPTGDELVRRLRRRNILLTAALFGLAVPVILIDSVYISVFSALKSDRDKAVQDLPFNPKSWKRAGTPERLAGGGRCVMAEALKAKHLPVGLSFVAGAWQEQCVINFAHAFEQRNPKRVTDLTE